MTPTIQFLKEQFPDAEIDAFVRSGCEEVLWGNPGVHEVFSTGHSAKKQISRPAHRMLLKRYDYAFDLSDSGRAKLWIVLAASRVRGINDAYQSVGWKRCLFNRISHFEWGKQHQVLRDFHTVAEIMGLQGEPGRLRFYPQTGSGGRPGNLPVFGDYAVIHPASRWTFKEWLPERWAAIADSLHREHGLNVVFSCGPGTREQNLVQAILSACAEEHFNTNGQLSLHELGRLLQSAKVFLGIDTVAMHLAAAMQTPTVALFGPSSEWSWRPWQCRHELVLGPCNCKATRKFICEKSKAYPCMEAITVEMVQEGIAQLLRASAK